jgi:hypothetical protein
MSKITSYGSGVVPPPPGAFTNVEGNTGGMVFANSDGTIFIEGDDTVTVTEGVPGDNELVIAAPGAANQFVTDAGTARVVSYVINVVGGENVSTSGFENTVTINANTQSQIVGYTLVAHAQSPYTVLPIDYYIAVDVSAGVVSILLPNAPAEGRIFVVKDKEGLSQVDNITVTTVGGAVTIDGGTSFLLNNAYESTSLLFNGVSYEIY